MSDPIIVDDREGSGQLAPLLRARGVPVQVGRIGFGDLSFIGCGVGGAPVTVGIEVKRIRDVLQCITDGRFAGHQLPGLVASHDQAWLLVEGVWRAHPVSGVLETLSRDRWVEATVGPRRFMWKDLQTWLLTIQIKAGVQVVKCGNWGDAISWVAALYQWWTKGWEEHKSHVALHNNNREFFDRAVLTRPTTLRMVASQLPGIGFDKSAAIAGFFGSVESLVLAAEWEIQQVPGIGPELARRVYNSLRSRA